MAKRVPTSLISFGPTAKLEAHEDLDVTVLKNWANFRRFKADPVNLTLPAQLQNADIIHCHQTRTISSGLALLYGRWAHKPVFTTDHGGGGIELFTNPRRFAGHLHVSHFSRSIAGHDQLESARVILGGVDIHKFAPNADIPRNGSVLYVGRLMPHKGIDYLIEAVEPTTPLTVLGRTVPGYESYVARLRGLSIGKQVIFLTASDDLELVSRYRQALCVVLPSVYTTALGDKSNAPELLGQTLIEGMACGTPVICTNVGGLPEVVEDGVTGFVVPPNDVAALRSRITYLKTQPMTTLEMGEAARRRVLENFTWDLTVDRCLLAYRQVLESIRL